jgi:hypothetical protein
MLEISTGAVRNRLSRGTLPSTKESGTVYVLLAADTSRDAERDTDDTPGGIPPLIVTYSHPSYATDCATSRGSSKPSARPTLRPAGCSPPPWSGSRP